MIWYWGTGGSWWTWLLGIVMTVLFWGLLAWVIAALWSGIRRIRRHPGAGRARNLPATTLVVPEDKTASKR